MRRLPPQFLLPSLFACLLTGLGLAVALSATAQDGGVRTYDPPESGAPQNGIGSGNTSEGPVRLARFSYVHGNVTWRTDDSADWSNATNNLPLRQGAQIWVSDGGRAEVQFDDGSLLRLGSNAVATLQTLYSDSEGEFTEIKLSDGLASLRLKHDRSIYQVDTPLVSVKATGPAKLRIGAGNGVEVGVREGQAAIEGNQGRVTLQSGDYLDLEDVNSTYDVRALPRGDSWEDWNDERDRRLQAAEQSYREHHVPSDIAIVATDLDTYGSWRTDPTYGSVWCPRITVADWRPYYYGHWTWCNPFGWTWVSEEPWGWAPYHYGSWVYASYGWAWVPGPVHQYWCPAVVHFTEYEGRVAWCPLAPSEVRYPSFLSIGFRHGNWATYFSIGSAAVYYPTYNNYCEPRVFNTTYINHYTVVNNVTNINGGRTAFDRYQNSAEYFAANHNTYLNGRFVPINARNASGVTTASLNGFGGRGQYQPVSGPAASLFQRGRTVAAPPDGRAPIAGPAAVKPTYEALTPTRTFTPGTQPPRAIIGRPVYRAPVNPAIDRAGLPIHTINAGGAASPGSSRSGRPVIGTPGSAPGTPSTGRPSVDRAPVLPGRTGRPYGGDGAAPGGSDTPRRDTSPGSLRPREGRSGTMSPEQEAAIRARNSLGLGGSRSRPPSDTGSTVHPNTGAGSSGTPSAPSNGGRNYGTRTPGEEGRYRPSTPRTDSPPRSSPNDNTPSTRPRGYEPPYSGSRSRPTDRTETPRYSEPRRTPSYPPSEPASPSGGRYRTPESSYPSGGRSRAPETPRSSEPRREAGGGGRSRDSDRGSSDSSDRSSGSSSDSGGGGYRGSGSRSRR